MVLWVIMDFQKEGGSCIGLKHLQVYAAVDD